MSIIRTKRYTVLEILETAFPKGVRLETGKEVDHVINEKDLAANPGLEKDVKIGDIVQLPELATFAVKDIIGKYAIVIGGIQGIVDPARKIIVDHSTPLEITVGSTNATVEVVEPTEETPEK